MMPHILTSVLDKCELSALHFQGKIPQFPSDGGAGRVVEEVRVL